MYRFVTVPTSYFIIKLNYDSCTEQILSVPCVPDTVLEAENLVR